MRELSFDSAPVPVRDDIRATQSRAWARLAEPGTWWTGAERVAIAAEVRQSRSCALCLERRSALSPHAVEGEHTRASELPEVAVDVVHRIASDPARLSRTWFEKSQAGGLSDAHYVELVGVVVTVVSIDSFCRGVGMPLHSLPEPEAGEPSRARPAAAEPGEAWVPMLPNGKASGELADLFPPAPGGRTGNVIRALSLVPDEVRGLLDLSGSHYLTPEAMMDLDRGRTLDRRQIELIAGRVSALNECFY